MVCFGGFELAVAFVVSVSPLYPWGWCLDLDVWDMRKSGVGGLDLCTYMMRMVKLTRMI